MCRGGERLPRGLLPRVLTDLFMVHLQWVLGGLIYKLFLPFGLLFCWLTMLFYILWKLMSYLGHRVGQYVWEDHRPASGLWKGTSGGEVISFSGCDDHQTSADTSVSFRKTY